MKIWFLFHIHLFIYLFIYFFRRFPGRVGRDWRKRGLSFLFRFSSRYRRRFWIRQIISFSSSISLPLKRQTRHPQKVRCLANFTEMTRLRNYPLLTDAFSELYKRVWAFSHRDSWTISHFHRPRCHRKHFASTKCPATPPHLTNARPVVRI